MLNLTPHSWKNRIRVFVNKTADKGEKGEREMKGRLILKVRPKKGASITFLSSVLAGSMPAVVTKTVSGGKATLEPDKEGNFEVRLLDETFEARLKRLLESTSFEVLELQEVA